MFNLFGKKKDKNYFLEIEEKNEVSQEILEEVTEELKQETTQKSASKKAVTAAKGENQVTSTKTIVKKESSASSYDQPEWVKAIKNYSETEENKAKKEINFASNYLMRNMPLSRRTAGPSLNSFKAMASSIKKG